MRVIPTLDGELRSPSGVTSLAARTPEQAIKLLLAGLEADGFVHYRGCVTRDEFFVIAEEVGVPWKELYIFVNPAEPMYVRNPGRVPFHTDSVRANVIGWHCIRECTTDITNRFLDGWDAFARLTPRERELLEGYAYLDRLRQVASDDGAPVPVIEPLGTGADGRARLFWLPHVAPDHSNPERGAALARLDELLNGTNGTRVVEARLRPGDFVFVNNNRFLHGRDALPPSSPRLLYRLWINTEGWPQALLERVVQPTRLHGEREAASELLKL